MFEQYKKDKLLGQVIGIKENEFKAVRKTKTPMINEIKTFSELKQALEWIRESKKA